MSKTSNPIISEAREAVGNKEFTKAESLYRQVLKVEHSGPRDEKLIQDQETALSELGTLYQSNGKVQEIVELVRLSRTITGKFAKSKTAKIIRTLIDLFNGLPNTIDVQISTTEECIEWAKTENRNFLRQSLQSRLIGLYFDKSAYHDALELINSLLRELKRLDDKMMLVEVQLLESRVYHALRNIGKARACLTSARTSANSVYCPILTQAALDNMSGILQAEDKDYKTAFSYFFEAFEGYSSQDDARAIDVLKYLLLSKIMLNLASDIETLLRSKPVQKYAGRDLDAMKAIATAHSNRSLKEFEQALETYKKELSSDSFIRSHFSALYDTLLEQNLVKVIEPFSCVEISHVAELIGLDTRQIEGKLSQMILDKVFYGVLDQGNGWLFIYDEPSTDKTYDLALDTVKHMSAVVDTLYEKAAALN
jgi:26S proteasome regulatory subunit N6